MGGPQKSSANRKSGNLRTFVIFAELLQVWQFADLRFAELIFLLCFADLQRINKDKNPGSNRVVEVLLSVLCVTEKKSSAHRQKVHK
jgi:hypothetical protein